MASLNPNLILQAGQTADVMGAFGQGNALAQRVNEQQRQNALTGFLGQNAGALMAGDQSALNALVQHDPNMAFNLSSQFENRRIRQEETAYQRGRDQVQDARLARQDERAAKMDARADEQWRWQVEEYAAKKSQAERIAEAQQVEEAVKMGLAVPDAVSWDAMMAQTAPDLVGQFDNRQALAQRYMSIAEILKGQQGPQPQSGPGKVQADINAGFLPAGTPLRGEGTSVKVDMGGGPKLGTLSTDYGYVMNPDTGQPVIDPQTGLPTAAAIPGSPASLDAAAAAAKAQQGGAAKAVSTDTVLNAANEARALIGRNSTGTIGAGLSYLPESDAAEVYRQIDVMKGIATIETLTAMRQASPTGGALGSVTEKEGAMLAAAAGAIDPKSGSERFARQLDNYERTLLRIIHGPTVGDAVYDQTRSQQQGNGQDGGVTSISTDADYDALPPGATFRDPNGVIRRKP